ncbi:MAG: type II toxin-antitoxin system VapC family toxin [Candidatus Bathyarchaeia archaeon]
MIVIDASALASLLMMERGHEKIARHLKDSISVNQVAKEVGNAIWKAYARGFITKEDALGRFSDLIKLTKLVVRLFDEMDLIEDAIGIAIDESITLYDSLYVALALREGAELLTLDRDQARAARNRGIKVIEIC